MSDVNISSSTPVPFSLNVRRIGWINGRGLWELYLKEIRRFTKVWLQTLASPLVTTLIFLAIFGLAIGDRVEVDGGLGFLEFLAPGLIAMAIVQNAFANTSSSLMIAKVQGSIVDTLMPPLSPLELTVGFAMGGVTRGLIVGVAVGVCVAFFVPLHLEHPFYIVYHAIGASLMLALMGIMAAIWSDKFDHMAAITNFIVTPLSFLSGTFYTIDRLPQGAQFVATFNPFFHMIDGFRYGFIGHDQAAPLVGLFVVGGVNIALAVACWLMLKSGYKLKS